MAVGELDRLVEEMQARTGIPGIAVAVVERRRRRLREGLRRARDRQAGAGRRRHGVPARVGLEVGRRDGGGARGRRRQRGLGHADDDLLPWFALGDQRVTAMLTVGDLYAHRSGLPDHAGDDLEDLGYDRRQVLERLRLSPAEALPRQLRVHQLRADRRGGGGRGRSRRPTGRPCRRPRSTGRSAWTARARALPTSWRATTARCRMCRSMAHGSPGYQRDPDAQSPAGGSAPASTTWRSGWRWCSRGGKPLMAIDALLPALSPQAVSGPPGTPDSRASSYGFGSGSGSLPLVGRMFSHSGAFALGAATAYMLIPSENVGIVVLSNAAPVGAVEVDRPRLPGPGAVRKVTRDWYETFSRCSRRSGALRHAGRQGAAGRRSAGAPARDICGDLRQRLLRPDRDRRGRGRAGAASRSGRTVLATAALESGDTFVFEPQGRTPMRARAPRSPFARGADQSGRGDHRVLEPERDRHLHPLRALQVVTPTKDLR